MVRLNWTFQAKDDLKAIAEYISKEPEGLVATGKILCIGGEQRQK